MRSAALSGGLRYWWLAALGLALAYPWVYNAPYYHLLGFTTLMYAAMATSWNILGGYTGYKSLGHAAFFGLGAYGVAITHSRYGLDPFWNAPIIAFGVFLLAIVLGWIMLRTSGSAFVIATIAMLFIFRLLALNLKDLTNGSPGLSQPIPQFPPQYARLPFYYYMLGVLILAVATSAYIRRSRFGLGLLAIRDDEGKAETLGVNTTLYKTLAFGISAYFVALAGGIWSYNTVHISPVFAFDIIVAVNMILMTILGGIGTLWGPVLGAVILIPARDQILFKFGANEIHIAILGALMLAIILFLPRGILPTIQTAIRSRRAAPSAFAGAREMAELRVRQRELPQVAPGDETPTALGRVEP